MKVGTEMGAVVTAGYLQIKIKGVSYLAHRIAYAHYHGADPYPLVIDHKNKNRADNSITNLRKVTKRQNAFGTAKRESKSGHTGVSYRTRRKRPWMVMCNKKYIGSYATLDEALLARAEAVTRLQRWAS